MEGSSGDEYEVPVESRRRAIATIFGIVFVDLLGSGILVPVVPLYAERSGASESVVGLLLASDSVTRFALAPVLGRRLPVAVRRRRPGDGARPARAGRGPPRRAAGRAGPGGDLRPPGRPRRSRGDGPGSATTGRAGAGAPGDDRTVPGGFEVAAGVAGRDAPPDVSVPLDICRANTTRVEGPVLIRD